MAGVLSAMDGPEQRPAPERCLGSQTVQPPILSIRNGVNLHQIVQTADSFLFVSEFIGAARIIRLSSKRLPAAITSWLGDSIGRWEGDVLVVETRGFTPSDHLRTRRTVRAASSFRRERSSRSGSLALPRTGSTTHSWSTIRPTTRSRGQGESHFLRRDEPMLEYACHEANYSLVHILEGARERDRREVR